MRERHGIGPDEDDCAKAEPRERLDPDGGPRICSKSSWEKFLDEPLWKCYRYMRENTDLEGKEDSQS